MERKKLLNKLTSENNIINNENKPKYFANM